MYVERHAETVTQADSVTMRDEYEGKKHSRKNNLHLLFYGRLTQKYKCKEMKIKNTKIFACFRLFRIKGQAQDMLEVTDATDKHSQLLCRTFPKMS